MQKEYEIKIFTWMWKKRLKTNYPEPAKVIKVKGWRTALIEGSPYPGGRSTVTFLFRLRIGKWEKYI
ncbi:MAG: hypothetical protein ABFD07_04815 [Methanobacterium sp.]